MKANGWPTIFGIYLFGVCGASTVTRLVPLSGELMQASGLSPAAFGWLVSIIALPSMLLALGTALVVERWGSRRVMGLGAAAMALIDGLYLVAASPAALFVLRVLEGTAIVHIYTAAAALLMASTEGRRRTIAMTLWATYMPVGTAFGLALAGGFAHGAGWRGAFLVHGACLLAAALIATRLPRAAPRPGPRATVAGQLRLLRAAYADPALLRIGGGYLLVVGLGIGANLAMPLYLAQTRGWAIGAASAMVALPTLAMIPGSLLAGWLRSRGFGAAGLFAAVGVVGAAAGLAVFAPALPTALLYVAMVAWFVASGCGVAVLLTLLPSVAGAERHGAAAALLNQSAACAVLLSPPLWFRLAAAGRWLPFAIVIVVSWALAAALLVRPFRPREA